MLKQEIDFIQTVEIKDFVLHVIDKITQKSFWTRPASNSGHNHPVITRSENGLVIHTKLALWWAGELMYLHPELTLEQQDIIRASVILHDMYKDGDGTKNAVKTHGLDLANIILQTFYNNEMSNVPTNIQAIIKAVANHMGIWGIEPNPFADNSLTTKLVHLADYVASRQIDQELAKYSCKTGNDAL